MTEKIQVLVIDDDIDTLTILRYCFADTTIELFCAASGEEGLKMALAKVPPMILLDVMMPKMDGIATLQALQLLPTLNNVCIVFLTAKAQKQEIEEYLQMGVFDVITKPFDPLTLPQKVLAIYDRYQKT